MRLTLAAALLAGMVLTTPAQAEDELLRGFEAALQGCEKWVLEPAAWLDKRDSFVASLELDGKAGFVDGVPDAALPPAELRVSNHYLRINSTISSGYFLAVSDRLPMCHITGGGQEDLQPLVEAVLTSSHFRQRWRQVNQTNDDGMVTSTYQNSEEPNFSMHVSRADAAGARTVRVQVLATAIYDLGN